MKPDHIIQTKRLTLKSVSPANVHELFLNKSKEEIMDFFACDENTYEFYREMHEGGMETHRISLFFFRIIHSESHRVIGEFGFHTWNKTHRRAELYYNIRKEEDKKQGFMSETMENLLKFGFTTLNLHRIQALVDKENTPSVKLLQRFGFTFEGTMREDYQVDGIQEDSDCYSLLKTEWEKNQN
jgi:[ribosomal protein S5]-alanine N-acetyltransferase